MPPECLDNQFMSLLQSDIAFPQISNSKRAYISTADCGTTIHCLIVACVISDLLQILQFSAVFGL